LSKSLWALDVASGGFAKLDAQGDKPPGAPAPVFALPPGGTTAWLVGAASGVAGELLGEPWSLELATLTWTHPAVVSGPQNAVAVVGGAVPGGLDVAALRADGELSLWHLDTTQGLWQPLLFGLALEGADHIVASAYDATTAQALVLAAGPAGPGVWVVDFGAKSVTQLSVTLPAATTAGVSLALYSDLGAVAFGGADANGAVHGETWALWRACRTP
jgi:hypothetical protein